MSLNKPSIVVLGAGSWGTALAMVLVKNAHLVYLWDRNSALLSEIARTQQNTRYLPNIALPSQIVICHTLVEAISNAQIILIAVPSHAFCEVLRAIKPFLKVEHGIMWATKGLEPATGHFLHEVVERELGQHHAYAAISGPSFAKEVALGLPTAVIVASKNTRFADNIARSFNCDTFRVYITDDMIGVQLGGVVKNILAVAVGISDGIPFGANTRAALITSGLAEMMQLGQALGGRRETLMGLAGCGDIILSCTDNQSRNRRFGLALAKGLSEAQALKEVGQVVEAVYNVEQLRRLAMVHNIELPIADRVFGVMKDSISPREAISGLFRRVPGSE